MSFILTTPKQSISKTRMNALKPKMKKSAAERLPKKTQSMFAELLNSSNIDNAIVDIHCHAFTHRNIPEDYLKNVTWVPRGIANVFMNLATGEFAKTYKMDHAKDIVDQMYDIYFDAGGDAMQHVFGGLLMMDMQRAIGGDIEHNYDTQLADVATIVRSRYQKAGRTVKYGDYVLPFLALDPHNLDMYRYFVSAFTSKADRSDELPKAVAPIFQGVKLYPALGYLPYHPVLMNVFAICEKLGIPITSHCGGIRTHPSASVIESQYIDRNGDIKTKRINLKDDKANGQKFSEFFVKPEHWDRVLKYYPNLKVNIAHMGSNEEWKAYRKGERHGTVQRTFNLIKKHKNVYADFSYSFYKKVNIKAIYDAIQEQPYLREKIMYGSDYYMCQVEKGELADYYHNVKEVFRKDTELHDNFFVKNAIRFLMD